MAFPVASHPAVPAGAAPVNAASWAKDHKSEMLVGGAGLLVGVLALYERSKNSSATAGTPATSGTTSAQTSADTTSTDLYDQTQGELGSLQQQLALLEPGGPGGTTPTSTPTTTTLGDPGGSVGPPAGDPTGLTSATSSMLSGSGYLPGGVTQSEIAGNPGTVGAESASGQSFTWLNPTEFDSLEGTPGATFYDELTPGVFTGVSTQQIQALAPDTPIYATQINPNTASQPGTTNLTPGANYGTTNT